MIHSTCHCLGEPLRNILDNIFGQVKARLLRVVYCSITYSNDSIVIDTYISRERRSVVSDDMIDMVEAEKRLVAELGENVCIYTRVCLHHAEKARKSTGKTSYNVDWDDVFR